ncbi:hypothetical protein NQ318_006772 [Aromia moschata]|uniref:Major facilitator superfamily (MFS) profile domain-containing protein n=1 Tax=Aromia moschata TaxID=1265417 RepID=A0AAV8Y629_9CUCU|nr:hypothetical protein NQ318_006772 [Aromia moschata]
MHINLCICIALSVRVRVISDFSPTVGLSAVSSYKIVADRLSVVCVGHNLKLYFLGNLVALTAGASIGWPAPYLAKLSSEDHAPLSRPVNTNELAWLASLMSLAALFSALVSAVVADRIGRKWCLVAFSVPMVASDILFLFSTSVAELYAARILVGIGVGSVWSIIPVYVAEISKPENRGVTSLFFMIACSTSQIITYIVAQFISIRIHAIISLAYTTSFLVLFGIFVPESPYYLVIAKKMDKAEKNLARLRRTDDVKEELALIVNTVEDAKIMKSNSDSWKEIFHSKPVVKGLLVTLGLFFFQQMCGSAVMAVYLQLIFIATKTGLSSAMCLIISSVIQFLSTLIATQFIDLVDRRVLLFVANVGLTTAVAGLGTYFHFQSAGFNMNCGLGSLTFVIGAEILPTNHLRTYLNGIATTFCIGTAFAVSFSFPYLELFWARKIDKAENLSKLTVRWTDDVREESLIVNTVEDDKDGYPSIFVDH